MIHKYKLNGFNIVLDVNSGAVHVVDDVSFDVLNYIDGFFFDYSKEYVVKKLENKYSKKDIEESYNELFELYQNGQLFSKDIYEHIAKNLSTSQIKAICLNVAHNCNLKCEYCFASKGSFGGKAELMTLKVAKKSIDFLIQNSGERKNLDLEFFGGEPLLNFEVVKETVRYAREQEKKYNKNFKFTITTNGILLNSNVINFINKEMTTVVLSLDGRREINDKFRLTNTKTGSYDIIIPKFKKIVEARNGQNYYIRGTFTKHNLDFTNDIMHIYKLGFNKIALEPVICDEKVNYSINEEHLNSIFAEYEKLANKIITLKKSGSKIDFFHFNIDLKNGPCAVKRIRGCGCGNEYLAVTPSGDIFPCHQFVGYDEYKMGNATLNAFDPKIKSDFVKTGIYYKEKCKNCWAKFYCTGGCNANNHQLNKNILIPHEISCAIQKKRLECAIMVQAALNIE